VGGPRGLLSRSLVGHCAPPMFVSSTSVLVVHSRLDASRLRCCTEKLDRSNLALLVFETGSPANKSES
jgi:hypothetical protein